MRRLVSLALLVLFAGPASAQLVPRDGSPPIRVKSPHVNAGVEAGLARTTVRQTFVNRQSRPLEAIFQFPVPEGAALVDVAMEVGGQRLEGLRDALSRERELREELDVQSRVQRGPRRLTNLLWHDLFVEVLPDLG